MATRRQRQQRELERHLQQNLSDLSRHHKGKELFWQKVSDMHSKRSNPRNFSRQRRLEKAALHAAWWHGEAHSSYKKALRGNARHIIDSAEHQVEKTRQAEHAYKKKVKKYGH